MDSNLNVCLPPYYGESRNPLSNSVRDLLSGNVCLGHTMLMNRELREHILSVENWDNIHMHDWWAAIVGATFGSMIYIEQPLALYRQHTNNTVGLGKKKLLDRARHFVSLQNIKVWCKQQNEIRDESRLYAKELARIISEEHADYAFIKQFSTIEKNCKLNRILFYVKNHLFLTFRPILVQILFV